MNWLHIFLWLLAFYAGFQSWRALDRARSCAVRGNGLAVTVELVEVGLWVATLVALSVGLAAEASS